MALSDTQVRQLRAKLEAKHVKTRKANGADLHYVEGWHVIAEANRIFGYDAWDRRTLASRCVCSGAERRHTMKRPIRRKCASACGPATSPSCARAQAAAKPRPLPQGKPMNLRSKALKPTPPSGRSLPLAIPLDLRFMTVSRSGCARRAVGKMRRQLAHGFCARHQVAKRRASTNPVHLPRRFARR